SLATRATEPQRRADPRAPRDNRSSPFRRWEKCGCRWYAPPVRFPIRQSRSGCKRCRYAVTFSKLPARRQAKQTRIPPGVILTAVIERVLRVQVGVFRSHGNRRPTVKQQDWPSGGSRPPEIALSIKLRKVCFHGQDLRLFSYRCNGNVS